MEKIEVNYKLFMLNMFFLNKTLKPQSVEWWK